MPARILWRVKVPWTPIGAEQTASGYEVAWKVTGGDQYTVWNTDSNGNYVSNIGVVSATSSTLQSLETSFNQDLNGDGHIGPVGSPSATAIAWSLKTFVNTANDDTFKFSADVAASSKLDNFPSDTENPFASGCE